jgi:ferredoxin
VLEYAVSVEADDGERSIVEQLLCAAAPILVMCHTPRCANCSRGLDSGYVAAIYQHRKQIFQKSVRSNARGGIFDWY